MLDRLVAAEVLTPYERDYELDQLTWYYDEMGGGAEGKRKNVLGGAPKPGEHYRPCVVTTGDSQDPFHTSQGIFVNNHLLDKPFVVQSGKTVNRNNAENVPDDWGCGANKKGSMTVALFMSLCIYHVENNASEAEGLWRRQEGVGFDLRWACKSLVLSWIDVLAG